MSQQIHFIQSFKNGKFDKKKIPLYENPKTDKDG